MRALVRIAPFGYKTLAVFRAFSLVCYAFEDEFE